MWNDVAFCSALISVLVLLSYLVSVGRFDPFKDVRKQWKRAFGTLAEPPKDGDKGKGGSIFREHGLVTALLFAVFRTIRWLTPTFILIRPVAERASECKRFGLLSRLWDAEKRKSVPAWQDASYLIPTLLLVTLASCLEQRAPAWATAFALWGLLDIVVYQINMFWFDALYAPESRVWSFRRGFFQAVIGYGASMLYFETLYAIYAVPCGAREVADPWNWSFAVATSLGAPEALVKITSLWQWQVALSLLLLVMIIGTIASQLFGRAEIAAPPPTSQRSGDAVDARQDGQADPGSRSPSKGDATQSSQPVVTGSPTDHGQIRS